MGDGMSDWISSGLTPTYVNGTQFTVPGNDISLFQVGRRVQATVSAGTVYGIVTSSVYSTVTTVTLVLDGTEQLDSGLSVVNVGLLNALNPSVSAYGVSYNRGSSGAVNTTVESRLQQIFNVFDYGAKGDGTTDDSTAFQNSIDAAQAAHSPLGGASGIVYAPAGYEYKIATGLVINIPIIFDCQSFINYTPTSGTALMIGASAPTYGNQAYDIHIAGLVNSTGNTGQPTSINTSGTTGIQVNSMAFSRLRVDAIQGFTYRGLYLDGLGDLGFQQVIQHNTIQIGQIVNNGLGLSTVSLDASSSSVEANRFDIQNIYQSYTNIQVDDASHYASTSNTFLIDSMDDNASGGVGLDMYGRYNYVRIGYTACAIRMNTSAMYNTVYVQNNLTTGLIISYGGTNNWITSGPPDSGQLPATNVSITAGTVYQNVYGVPIVVYFSALITPSTGSSETVNANVGNTSSPAAVLTAASAAMTTPDSKEFPFTLYVPPGYYWSVTTSGSGTATLSSATILQAGA
jgi:hypothetical protein